MPTYIDCANPSLHCAEYSLLIVASLFAPSPPLRTPQKVHPTLSKSDLKLFRKKLLWHRRIQRQTELPPATPRDLVDSWEKKPLNCE